MSKMNHMSLFPAPVHQAELRNPDRLGKDRGGVRGREQERERGRGEDNGGREEIDRQRSQGTNSLRGGNARARAKRDIESESDVWRVRDEKRKREGEGRIVWDEETTMRRK